MGLTADITHIEQAGHDGYCDHGRCTRTAEWMIAERCDPELWGPSVTKAALAFYCDEHVDGVQWATPLDVTANSMICEPNILWAIAIASHGNPIKVVR